MADEVPADEELSDDEYDTFAHLKKLPQARVSGTLSKLESSIYKQKARKAAVSHELVERSLLKIADEKKNQSYHNISNPHNFSKIEDKPLLFINKKKLVMIKWK